MASKLVGRRGLTIVCPSVAFAVEKKSSLSSRKESLPGHFLQKTDCGQEEIIKRLCDCKNVASQMQCRSVKSTVNYIGI